MCIRDRHPGFLLTGRSCWSAVHGTHCYSLYATVSVLCQGTLPEVYHCRCTCSKLIRELELLASSLVVTILYNVNSDLMSRLLIMLKSLSLQYSNTSINPFVASWPGRSKPMHIICLKLACTTHFIMWQSTHLSCHALLQCHGERVSTSHTIWVLLCVLCLHGLQPWSGEYENV